MTRKNILRLVILPIIALMLCGMLSGCGAVGKHPETEELAVEFTEYILENASQDDEVFIGETFLAEGYTDSLMKSANKAAKRLSKDYAEAAERLGGDITYEVKVYGVYDRVWESSDNPGKDAAVVRDVLVQIEFKGKAQSETYKFVRLEVTNILGVVSVSDFKISSDLIFATPIKEVNKFLDIFINRSGYVDVLEGLKNTAIISVVGLVIGIVIGTLIATVRVIPKYNIIPRILNGVCTFYVGFFRGTPMAVQLLLFYYVLFPILKMPIASVDVSILVFGLNSGAYISELMRAGIQSVDPGQMEAGRAVGLSFPVTMIKVVIPQAVKNILPTLGNEFIALIKETSVVSFVGATNLYTAFNMIGSNSYEFIVPFLAMAVIYIVIIMIITLGIKLMERGLQKSDRRS